MDWWHIDVLERVSCSTYFIIWGKKDSQKLANLTSKNDRQMFLDVYVELRSTQDGNPSGTKTGIPFGKTGIPGIS